MMPIFIGEEIEVVAISPVLRGVQIVIHFIGDDATLPDFMKKEKAVYLGHKAKRYLAMEGFIPKQNNSWAFQIAGVSHKPVV